jgi:hypothetical protein
MALISTGARWPVAALAKTVITDIVAYQSIDWLEVSDTCMRNRYTLLLITLLLAACEPTADTNFCKVTGDNLIKNPLFSAKTTRGSLKHWTTAQHAGENSYQYTVDNGELSISKIGTQPWFVFKQRMDTPTLAGKKLAFYAELKLDLRSPAIEQAPPIGGGLSLTAKAGTNGQGKILMAATLLNEPRLGKVDWHPVQVVVELPAKTQSVILGGLQQADGSMKIRNPKLQRVDESRQPCEVTPGADLFKPQKSSLR